MELGKLLMIVGTVFILIGILFYFGDRFFPIGRLPGDLRWETENIKIYFPIFSCVLISIIGTIILNLFFRK